MENQHKDSFQYTYSAKAQHEIRCIRSKYVAREESKLDQLRRIDAAVTRRATAWAITIGVTGTLLLGTGMSCCMVWGGSTFVPGIIIGVAGIVIVSLTYPLYNRVLQKERKRAAPEVLRLTDELMK